MGKKKRYLIRTVNFGKEGERSRLIAEKLIQKVGPRKFSILIKELLVNNYARDKQFNDLKVNVLINERKLLGEDLQNISKKLRENADELQKKGVKL